MQVNTIDKLFTHLPVLLKACKEVTIHYMRGDSTRVVDRFVDVGPDHLVVRVGSDVTVVPFHAICRLELK